MVLVVSVVVGIEFRASHKLVLVFDHGAAPPASHPPTPHPYHHVFKFQEEV